MNREQAHNLVYIAVVVTIISNVFHYIEYRDILNFITNMSMCLVTLGLNIELEEFYNDH